MIHLDCSGIRFGSQLDEHHLFTWAREISAVVGWEQDALVIRSRRLSEEALRDLLALFWRYEIPMGQLAQFRNIKNEHWFAAPKMYWHKRVFGREASQSLKASALDKRRGEVQRRR